MTDETDSISKRRFNPLMMRKFHTYIGVLIAPSMLFFSATGAYQLFGLHEGHPGEAYQPVALLVELSAVHKDQKFALDSHGPPAGAKGGEGQPEGGKPDAARSRHDDAPPGEKGGAATLLLKWYFLIVAIGMFCTTLLGEYLAFKYARAKRMIWALTIFGIVIPIALLVV